MPQLSPDAPRHPTARWAWVVWWVGVLVYVAALAWALSVLPDRVVAHTGVDGVDRWGSRVEHLVLSVTAGAVLILGVPVVVRQVARPPGTLLNLAHKEYWLAEPHRAARFRARVTEDALVLAGGLGLFLAAQLQVGTVRVTADPSTANGPWSWGALVLFVAGMLAWTWWVAGSGRHRPPREVEPAR